MRNYWIITALIISITVLANPLHAENSNKSLREANLKFALKSYKTIREDGKNTFISPFSISTVLNMAAAGAANETKQEMEATLETTGITDLDLQQRNLLTQINRFDKSTDLELETANSIWLSNIINITDSYKKTLKENYFSELHTSDFALNPEKERKNINSWVAEKTKEKIQNLIPEGTLHTLTRLVLVNAIYFYGKWAIPFDPKLTKEEDFQPTGSESLKAMFMAYTKILNYYEDQDLQAVELSYQGNELSMLAILPKSSDLKTLSAKIDIDLYSKISKGLESKSVNIKLPKFKLESTHLLKGMLNNLGMLLAFDQNNSDFSSMEVNNTLFISEVIQKAFIEVNEIGSEAAAATAVVMVGRGLSFMQKVDFIANKPFIFLIRDKTNDTILFIGELHQPAI